MSVLLPADQARRSMPGFALFIGQCQRPSCAAPIVRVALARNASAVANIKWCSPACRRWAIHQKSVSPLVMLNGRCKTCGKSFTQRIHRTNTDAMTQHCSDRCQTTGKRVPCEACGGAALRPPEHAICALCFRAVANSCAGKDRYPTVTSARTMIGRFRAANPSRAAQNKPDLYTCWCCTAIHVGSTADMTPERITRIVAGAALLRQRLGPDRWDDLVEGWATQRRDTSRTIGPVIPAGATPRPR